MRVRPVMSLLAIAFALTGLLGATDGAFAQAGPGGLVNPIRDCQTIRTCRYARGGSYRGCISTYTCKTCKLVPARCEIDGRTQNCREMQCTWGG